MNNHVSAYSSAFIAHSLDALSSLLEREADHIATGAQWMADAIERNGLVRAFGTGHSRLLVEEIFYRAGGLAPVDAIFDGSTSGYGAVTMSEHAERLEGLGSLIVAHSRMAPPDVLLVFSQSGRNAVPIEVVTSARDRGVRTVAITSLLHSAGQPSRHSSGLHLKDVADLVIDTGTPDGDCSVMLPNGLPMGPLSTVVGGAVAQILVIETAHRLCERGIEPPVFHSGNVDGGREFNEHLLDRYWGRIRGW